MKTHLLMDWLQERTTLKMNIFLYLLHNIYCTLTYTNLTIGILGTTRRL
jgi:hypothetical protein